MAIFIRAFRHRATQMKLPRVVVAQHLMGRPLGAPHDAQRQRYVLRAALDLLESAREGGAIVELPEPYRAGGPTAPPV